MRSVTIWDRIFLALCVVCVLIVVEPFLIALAIGAIAAFISERPINRIARTLCHKTGLARSKARWAAAIFFVAIVLMIGLLPLAAIIYSATVQLTEVVSVYLSQMKSADMRSLTATWISAQLQILGVTLSVADVIERINALLVQSSQWLATTTGKALVATPIFLIDIAFGLATWIIFAVKGSHMRRRLLPLLIPWPNIRKIISCTVAQVIRGLVVANILVATSQAVVATLFLGFAGVPNFLAWGFLTFFAAFVPVIGTLPILGGGAIYCFLNSKIIGGISLIVGAVLVGTMDSLLKPLLMKGSLNLGFFGLLLSLLGGIYTLGPAGALLGPLAFALFEATVSFFREKSS